MAQGVVASTPRYELNLNKPNIASGGQTHRVTAKPHKASFTSGFDSRRHSQQSSGIKGGVIPTSTIGEKKASIGSNRDIKSESAYSFGNTREKSGGRIT